MGIFDPESDEEGEEEEIISDVVDLYTEIINGEPSEIQKCCTAYMDQYRKILKKLKDYLEGGFMEGPPDFVYELFDDIDPQKTAFLRRETELKKLEFGLKRIMKEFNVEIPERKERIRQENTHIPPVQNIIHTNQFMNNEINISNEIKIEVEQAIDELVKEVNKLDPNPTKLKKLFEIIKKGAGHGTIKVIEVLLKKLFGI